MKIGNKKNLVILLILISSPFWMTLLLSKPKITAKVYGDKQKKIHVQIHSTCSVESSGSFVFYEIDFNGKLARSDCYHNAKKNREEYKFVSNSLGTQDCYGKMTKIEESSQKIITLWKIEGSISGNHCSLTGKSLEFELEKTGSLSEGK